VLTLMPPMASPMPGVSAEIRPAVARCASDMAIIASGVCSGVARQRIMGAITM
jgi:hypothetical protein